MPNMISAALRSIFLTLLISLCIGACVFMVTTNTLAAIGALVLSFTIQFLVSYFLSIYMENRKNEISILQQKMYLESSARRVPINLTCAYCNTISIVPISFDNSESNNFICKTCNQPNRTMVQFSTVRITQPLVNKIEQKDIIEDLEKIDTIRQSTTPAVTP